MNPALPQHDLEPGKRAYRIAEATRAYHYVVQQQTEIVLLEHLPKAEEFSYTYRAKQLWALSKYLANWVVLELKYRRKTPETLAGYGRYYPLLRKPATRTTVTLDSVFGHQRLAGPNPMSLRRVGVDGLPEHFGVTDALLSQVLGRATTVHAEASEGHLFICDYSYLKAWAAEPGQHGRYNSAATILFHAGPGSHLNRGWGELEPIAIQVRPEPGSLVYTPGDGVEWLMAKAFAQISETTQHELCSHLACTHLMLEPIIMTMHRNMAPNHPVFLLLAQHFESTLAINDLGRATLVNPSGFLDQMMAPTLDDTMSIVSNAIGTFEFDKRRLRRDIADRGLDDTDVLPSFPYRDDGFLVLDAIETMVRDYLGLYYLRAEDVTEDAELQRWVVAMSVEGKLKGLPDRIDGFDALVALVSQIIWIAGPQHAAVNYPQWNYVAFVPNMPFAGYAPAPTERGRFTREGDLMAIYPKDEKTKTQILLMQALTGLQYTRLGHYPKGAFADPRAQDVMGAFRARLAEVETEIDGRNLERRLEYPFLKPSRIPNSTNT
ncbi:MAG: lipoxygenase family protein [Myxococcota bacterium]